MSLINTHTYAPASAQLAAERELLLIERPSTISRSSPFLVTAMSESQRRKLAFFVGAWLVVVALFSTWWFEPNHIGSVWRYAFNSAALGVAVLLPAYYFFFFS